jgi:hypothetical protein
VDTRCGFEILGGREVARVDGIGTAGRVEGEVMGEVVKGDDLAGVWLTGGWGNENTADGGSDTGRLLRMELGVDGREGAV